MPKVGIVTDSISCLPPELVKEYDIRVVPLGLSINGKAYRDQIDLPTDEFWRLFEGIRQFSTGAPPMGDFVSAFTELGKSTDSIFCTLVSKGLSATYEAAVQAREIARAENHHLNIEMVDSKTVAGAQGFIVLEAARAAQAGKSLSEVVQLAQDMIPRVKFIMGMETLKYLIRSGRAPKIAIIGEFLKVKPIVGMVNQTGVIENLDRVRGRQKCLARMVDMVQEYADTSKLLHIVAHYTNSIKDGEELRDMVTSRYDCVEVYFTPYTPVMSGHTGPVVALSFYS